MSLIQHKRSTTASAVPTTANLSPGELAINVRDGKAFTKKSDGVTESIIEFRGAIDQVRPAGQTGELCPSETAVREAIINAVPSDIIPIYYVTSFAQFISAYNSIRAQYAGGRIVCAGDIIMTSDLTLDMTGIIVEGDGCNWRFYNDVFLNPSSVRKLIITAGSPTFIGIRFWGSSGQSSIEMDKGTTRLCFDITPTDTSRSMYITFDRCAFLDIVAGQTTGPVIRVTANMASNASVNFTFIGCRIASHCAATGITYLGFKIYHSFTGSSTTNINVTVIDQVPSPELEVSNTSTLYVLQGYTTATLFSFSSDETAWLNNQTSLTGLTRSNNILNAPYSGSDPAVDYILISKDSDRKNIYRSPLSTFQQALTVKEGLLLGRSVGHGEGAPESISVGTGLQMNGDTLECTVSPNPTVPNDKAVLNQSVMITTSTAWQNIAASFDKTISLVPGTYLISAQAHFTRGTSTQTFAGFRLTVGGAVVLAAENDFYRHVTLHGSIILTVTSNTTITMQVYASAANVVSVVATTMSAPVAQAGQTTLINAVKIA